MERALLGFVAGFVSTLTFHQLTLWVLHSAAIAPRGPYAMNPVPPFGVPSAISLAFWGGIWGAILIPAIDHQRGAAFWIWAIVIGAIAPTLVAWFIVAPLKHQPLAGGFKPKAMAIGPIVNGMWGLGTAVIYRLLAKL